MKRLSILNKSKIWKWQQRFIQRMQKQFVNSVKKQMPGMLGINVGVPATMAFFPFSGLEGFILWGSYM